MIVGLAFAILSVTGGLTFYALSAYIDALVSDRGFSLQVASAGATMSALFGGLGGLATARMMRTVSTRLILVVGAIGLGIATAGVGASQTAWQLWIAFAASGWFGTMASGIPVSALVARWFPLSPARPLTLAMTGLSVGGAIIPPGVIALLHSYGLTKGSAVIGAGLIVWVCAATIFIKEPPPVERPDDAPAPDVAPASVRSKLFVVLFLGLLCLFLSQIATSAHMVRLASENGVGGGALAVSVMALGSFSGRVLGIPLLPMLGLRMLTFLVALTQALAQFVLSDAFNRPVLLLGSYLLGVAMGNVGVLQSIFAIEAYGLEQYPRMFARLSLGGPIGSGVGPLFVALVHGWTGGYRWPLMAMGIMSVLGAIGLWVTGVDSASSLRDKVHHRREATLGPPGAREVVAEAAAADPQPAIVTAQDAAVPATRLRR